MVSFHSIHPFRSPAAHRKAIADIDHRLDMETVRREPVAQAVNVDAKTDRVERLPVTPDISPEVFRRDDALKAQREARDDQKLRSRKLYGMVPAGNVIIVVLNA